MGKTLLCKHEDLKLIPDNQKKMDTVAHAGSPSTVLGARTRASLGLTDLVISAS